MSKSINLLERFLNGWHGKYGSTSVTFYTDNLNHCVENAIDGCVVLDKKDCGSDAINFVVNGPMVDVTLPKNTISRFSGHKELAFVSPALEGEFRTLAAKALTDKGWGGFDSVSLDLYISAWRDLGARIGWVKDGKVEWEDEK